MVLGHLVGGDDGIGVENRERDGERWKKRDRKRDERVVVIELMLMWVLVVLTAVKVVVAAVEILAVT